MAESKDTTESTPPTWPKLTANDLRWFAEGADGIRDEECVIAWEEKEKKYKVQTQKNAKGKPKLPFDISTPTDGAGLHGPVGITVVIGVKQSDGSVKQMSYTLDDKADAVFFTQSAVEKFVLPYYMRMHRGAWVEGKKNELFAEKKVMAVHSHPSETGGTDESLQALDEGSGAAVT